MYDQSDPRSAMPQAAKPAANAFGIATYARFYDMAPQVVGPGFKSWAARGETFLTVYSETEPGAILDRRDQPDEYAVLLPDPATRIDVEWGGQTYPVSGYSVAFVPPGDSRIVARTGGSLARFFTIRSQDLVAICANAADHRHDPNVPPIGDWPAPIDGPKVRSYSLDVPEEEGRFGRIFRCSTIMINYLDPRDGPRDPRKMSPHDHDDFQQGSLAVSGDYVHHLRWPWTTDMTTWRDDEHVACASPSICFIPARVLHTSQAAGPGRNQLVDVFCPPRADFSKKPGWVVNEADYPLPAGI